MKKTKKAIDEEIHKRHQDIAKRLLNDPEYIKAITEYEDVWLFGERANKLIKESRHLIKKIPKNESINVTPSSPLFKTVQRLKEIDDEFENMNLGRGSMFTKICKDFKIRFPYSLGKLQEVANGKDILEFEPNKLVDIIQLRPTTYEQIPPEQLTKEDLEFCPHHLKIIDDGHFDEDGCLHFKINPEYPRKIIHYFLDILLNLYAPHMPKKRRRESTYDPFWVRNEVNIKGKNLYKLAKEVSGINKPPSINGRVMAAYIALSRAYNKANQSINRK